MTGAMYDRREVDALAGWAYANGMTALAYAEQAVTQAIEVHEDVRAARLENPAFFPGYCIEMTWGAVARRILGSLMDAGWTPPNLGEPMPGCDR